MSNRMDRPPIHVSFDLDDTLVCESSVPTEPLAPLWYRRRYPERLRCGTRALLRTLSKRNCRIWIYTSSRRPPRYLQGWFRSIGVRLEGAINLCRHEETVGYRGPSKYPPAFGISLHVDDSPGVAMEGQAHGFLVLIVAPHDERWTDRVLAAVDAMQSEPPLHTAPLHPQQPMYALRAVPAVAR